MTQLKKIISCFAAVCATLAASAQEAPRTAYFMDGYSFRHELNPAFMGERNYISLPVLGNFDIALFSNVGVDKFLYPTEAGSPYKLTTFMSPTVDANKFLDKLAKNNHINFNYDMTILSTGFRAFKGFNTISIGLHTDMGSNLPKDLFRFMKLGQESTDTRYDFKDVKMNATAYAEIGLGHSHKINDKLTIGAKLKFLIGLGNVTAHIKKMDVRMSNEQWYIRANGELQMAAGSGLYVPTKKEANPNEHYTGDEGDEIEWGDIDYNSFGIAGYGLGIDLGATYQLLPDLQLSAAVTDLGFMNWKDAVTAKTGNGEWTFDGFQDIAISEDQPGYEENKLSEQLDRMWDDIQDVVNFHRDDKKGYKKMLNATVRVGAEYTMPFYRGLTGGFLFSSYIAGCQSWQEGRFYANLKPCRWFDCTVNYGASTYGSSFGWMINFHPKGFNFFVGSDHQFFKVTPQYVPVGNACASINFGFNVTFGSAPKK